MYSVAPELDCVPPSIFTFLINSLLLDWLLLNQFLINSNITEKYVLPGCR
jgi:hypothetical protein